MATIEDKDKQYFLNLKPEDLTSKLLFSLFADNSKIVDGKMVRNKSKYSFQDKMELKSGEYFNTTDITTNLGLFVINKILIERELIDVAGYCNNAINNSELQRIDGLVANALLVDKIDTAIMVKYIDRIQWIGMRMNSIVSVSFTAKTLVPLSKVTAERAKLLKANASSNEKGDPVALAKIEHKLLEVARDELKNDPGMMLYDSGARGSFGNNYKNMCVMKGPIRNPSTGKYDVVESSFIEGIAKKDIPAMGTSVVSGSYPKAVGTGVAGYFTKQILAAMQAVVADTKNQDCGSTGTIDILITPKNKSDLLFRFIMVSGKPVLLDEAVINTYVGKHVKMRSPMMCTTNKICKTCLGLMFEKLGIEYVGLTSARVSATILNLSMKKFHNTTAEIFEIKDTKSLFI